MNSDQHDCQSEHIAAYLDGELDEAVRLLFEAHLKECPDCGAQLAEQQRLLCQLDSVLSRGSALPLPTNFAQIVTAHAQSDMSGMRRRRERGRAFRLCMILVAASLALLGVAARAFVVGSARTIVRPISVAFDLAWRTGYDAVSSLAIVSRVLGQGLVPNSRLAGLVEFALLALAVLLLSRLIAGYHRTRLVQ